MHQMRIFSGLHNEQTIPSGYYNNSNLNASSKMPTHIRTSLLFGLLANYNIGVIGFA